MFIVWLHEEPQALSLKCMSSSKGKNCGIRQYRLISVTKSCVSHSVRYGEEDASTGLGLPTPTGSCCVSSHGLPRAGVAAAPEPEQGVCGCLSVTGVA